MLITIKSKVEGYNPVLFDSGMLVLDDFIKELYPIRKFFELPIDSLKKARQKIVEFEEFVSSSGVYTVPHVKEEVGNVACFLRRKLEYLNRVSGCHFSALKDSEMPGFLHLTYALMEIEKAIRRIRRYRVEDMDTYYILEKRLRLLTGGDDISNADYSLFAAFIYSVMKGENPNLLSKDIKHFTKLFEAYQNMHNVGVDGIEFIVFDD